MSENKLSFLKSAFTEYKVEFSDDFTEAIIVNPNNDENITVYYYEDDDFYPFCVCFSFQHCHLIDEENVIEWIEQIITGKKFAVEFFQNEQRKFGGEIGAERLKALSYSELEQFSGYYGSTKLFQIADTFKVRGWYSANNFDAFFICKDNGCITIKKLIKDNITLILPTSEKVIVSMQICYDNNENEANSQCEICVVYNDVKYYGKGTDFLWVDAFANLQKNLPSGIKVACCMTCRYGNMCPHGNKENELFCTKDLNIVDKMQLCNLSDENNYFLKRKVFSYHYCDDFVYQSDDYYTYNDYYYVYKKD